MKEMFAMLAFVAVLVVAFQTEIPAKAVAATERWLDGGCGGFSTHPPQPARLSEPSSKATVSGSAGERK